jgi:hypothetical protein
MICTKKFWESHKNSRNVIKEKTPLKGRQGHYGGPPAFFLIIKKGDAYHELRAY